MEDINKDEAYTSMLHSYLTITKDVMWTITGYFTRPEYDEPELILKHTIHGKVNEKFGLFHLRQLIKNEEGYGAFVYEKDRSFYIDIDRLKAKFPELFVHSWLKGRVMAAYHYEFDADDQYPGSSFKPLPKTHISLVVGKAEAKMSMPKRIFLSHKSLNKPIVREYFATLQQLGLQPWLDEEDMPAGRRLHRALAAGMKESIAAVFFITPEYLDEKFLSGEIDGAIDRKMELGEDFSIITIQIEDKDGRKGEIPDLLKAYVWKTIKYDEHLKGLREILRALPFEAKISG